MRNITVPVLIIELISDREKDIGPQADSYKSFGDHFYTFQLENSHTGILSDEGRRTDILETKVDLLTQKIIEFNKVYRINEFSKKHINNTIIKSITKNFSEKFLEILRIVQDPRSFLRIAQDFLEFLTHCQKSSGTLRIT